MSVKDKKIGFIGLGTMGTPMALNAAKAGFALSVYNRNPLRAESFRQSGIPVLDAPDNLARNSDIIIIMVTGPNDLIEIINGIEPVLTPGKTVINMTTVSIKAALRAAETTESKGAEFIDAPVSGSKKPAEDGTLVILAGGKPEAIKFAEPLLLSMGKEVILCGDIGMGTKMKLAINMLLGNMMTAFAESLTFGKMQGLEFDKIMRAIEGGVLASPFFKIKGEAISSDNFTKTFSVDLIYKDLNLALDAGMKSNLPMFLTEAAKKAYSGTVGLGLGDEDMAAVIKYYRKFADTKSTDGGK